MFDGYFTKKDFVDAIVELGLVFVGKLRKDANLKVLYKGPQKSGRGRNKKYEKKCDLFGRADFTYIGEYLLTPGKKGTVKSGRYYYPALKEEIAVVLVENQSIAGKVSTALLFSTDVMIDPAKLYQYYKARFQIEFIFRDAKQYTGLADCQSRNKESIHTHINASLLALNIIKMEDLIVQKNHVHQRPFSMASYKAKYHNETLIQSFFSMLGFDLTLIKESQISRGSKHRHYQFRL